MAEGNKIEFAEGKWKVPDDPVVLYAKGDGIGPEVTAGALAVADAAIGKAYGTSKRIGWKEVVVGDAAQERYGDRLPEETKKLLDEYRLLLKGPLTTPVSKGFRSINVTIRMMLDLYANIRPVKYIQGLDSPLRKPENVDMVIFRENTDDIYTGIEWKYDSPEAGRVREFMKGLGVSVDADAGIGLKPIGRAKTERITRMALKYALENRRRSVTIMHKGNIMKYTEGAFREWAYETAAKEFAGSVVTEADVAAKYNGSVPAGMLLLNDRIADNMFQQVIAKPELYDVILAPNLNGDYISDACGALIGDIGVLGSANVGDTGGMFEAVHGTAPKYAGKNLANPMGMIKAAELMLTFMGWKEAASLIGAAFADAMREKKVTQDIARLMGAEALGTREFSEALVGYIEKG